MIEVIKEICIQDYPMVSIIDYYDYPQIEYSE